MPPLLLLAVGSLVYGFAMVFIAGSVPARAGQARALDSLSRKIFHAGIFSGAVPAQILLGFWGVVVYGTVIAAMVLLGTLGSGRGGLRGLLARPDSAAGSGREILTPLASTALGGITAVLLVGSFAIVGYLVCGWGDGAGELVGREWGRRRYRPPFGGAGGTERSLEGSLAVLAVGAVGATTGLLLLGQDVLPALGVGALCGIVGAVAEGVSPGNTDNFWCQIIPALSAWWILG